MASEAERQAAKIALNKGIPAADRQAQIDAVFAPYSQPQPSLPTSQPAGPSMTVAAAPAPPVTNAFTGQPLPPQGAPGVTLPETTIAPRTGGGMPAPGRPIAGPAPWLRNAMNAPPGEAELFQNDFDQAMVEQGFEPSTPQTPRTGEEIRAEAQGDPGLRPHTPGVPETIDESRAIDEIGQESFTASAQKLEAGEEATQQTLERHRQQLDEQAGIDEENSRRAADRSQHLEKMETDYRSLSDSIQREPIDSQRLWNNKSTGEKVLSKLAIFLGTLGSGLAGTPNLAWESMQSDIDRDIEDQKSNKALQQSRLAAEGTLFGMARQRFGDEAVADAAMREAAYGRMAKELEHFEQSARTPERKAAIAELRASAEEKYLAAQQTRRQRSDAYVLEQERLRRLASAGPDPLRELKLKAKVGGLRASIAESDAKVTKAGREIAGGGVEVDQKAVNKANADYEATVRAIDKYENSNAGLGLTSGATDRSKAEAEATQAQVEFQNKYLGKSEGDELKSRKALPSGGTFTLESTVRESAKAARAKAKSERDSAIQAAGGKAPGFTPQTGSP